VLKGAREQITSIVVLPGGILAAGSHDGNIYLWPVATGAEPAPLEAEQAEGRMDPLQTLQGHSDRICDMAQFSNGRLVSASADGTVRMWMPTSTPPEGQPMQSNQISEGFKDNIPQQNAGSRAERTRNWIHSIAKISHEPFADILLGNDKP